jgi:hypothetical protein
MKKDLYDCDGSEVTIDKILSRVCHVLNVGDSIVMVV